MDQKQTTIGEYRVRVQFNPDNNGTVDQIKQRSATLMNLHHEGAEVGVIGQETDQLCELIYNMPSSEMKDVDEFTRLKDNAIDVFNRSTQGNINKDTAMYWVEIACMFAVKAATCERVPMEASTTN